MKNLEDQIRAEGPPDVSDGRPGVSVQLIRELGLVSGAALHLDPEALFDESLDPRRGQGHAALVLKSLLRNADHQVSVGHT